MAYHFAVSTGVVLDSAHSYSSAASVALGYFVGFLLAAQEHEIVA